MSHLLRAALATLACLALFGCPNGPPGPPPPDGGGEGGGGGGGGTGGGAPDAGKPADGGLSLNGACNLLNERRCEFLSRCGLLEQSEAAMRDCLAYFTATWCGPQHWPVRVTVGTLRYNAQLAQACADAFLKRGCSDWQELPYACSSFLGPNSYLTQACYGRYQECREGVCRGSCTPRQCQPPGLAGELCDEDPDCRTDGGLYCRILASSGAGLGSCTPWGGPGSFCDVETPCRAELFCTNQSQCEARRLPGQACIEGTCVESAFCQMTPMDGGFCAGRLDAGEGCTDDGQCQRGLLCQTVTGQCAPMGPLPDGGPCSIRQSCGGGNVCLGVTASQLGKCGAPLEEGGECLTSFDCDESHACAHEDGGVSSVCGARRATGSSCTMSRDCLVFDRCAGGVCARLPMPGSPCLSGACLFGTCDGQPDGGGVCGDMGGPGDSCLADGECGSNRCVFGRCLPACAP